MVHQYFDTSTIYYDDYIQTGSGLEKGDFFRGGSVYQRGYGVQRGAGIGDVFKGLWRFFRPILQRVGTTVGEEALKTGQRVIEDVKEGKPIKESLIMEGKKGIDTVLEQGGIPKQFGTCSKRRKRSQGRSEGDNHGFIRNQGRSGTQTIKRRRQVQFLPNSQTIIPTGITKPIAHSKKRLRSDVFGLY